MLLLTRPTLDCIAGQKRVRKVRDSQGENKHARGRKFRDATRAAARPLPFVQILAGCSDLCALFATKVCASHAPAPDPAQNAPTQPQFACPVPLLLCTGCRAGCPPRSAQSRPFWFCMLLCMLLAVALRALRLRCVRHTTLSPYCDAATDALVPATPPHYFSAGTCDCDCGAQQRLPAHALAAGTKGSRLRQPSSTLATCLCRTTPHCLGRGLACAL
jgi:hypothetical protein